MASGKRFIKNTGIYFIGSFATKLLQFLLIPLYTKYITTEDLGNFNLITVSVSLALPLLFQSIWEGSFRFAIEKGDDARSVIASSTKYCLLLTVLYSVIFIVVSTIIDLDFAWLILAFGLAQVLSSYWQFSARALKENVIYATSAVINTLVSIMLNIVLIIGFNQGIKSLLIANTVGTIVMVGILEYRLRILRDINQYPFDKALLKNIIKYSLPLAINSVSWWMFSSCNNYIITAILGSSANGIYSMALRFGTILSTITSIVTLSWNEEAFRTYGDVDRDDYFNKLLTFLTKALFGLLFILTPLTYIIYKYWVFGDYYQGVNLIAPIYWGAVFNALSCHLGSALLARKESNILFFTTLGGGVISILTSIVLIYFLGLQVASLGTLIGYVFIYLIRIPILKTRFPLQSGVNTIIILFILNIAVAVSCAFLKSNVLALVGIVIVSTILAYLFNREFISKIITKIIKKNNE